MCRAIAAIIGMLFILLTGPEPASAQSCCQFENRCTTTTRDLCRREHGVPKGGLCMFNRCTFVAPRPQAAAGPKVCCQFKNGGCSDTFDIKGCRSVGGIPAVKRHCAYDGVCRR